MDIIGKLATVLTRKEKVPARHRAVVVQEKKKKQQKEADDYMDSLLGEDA